MNINIQGIHSKVDLLKQRMLQNSIGMTAVNEKWCKNNNHNSKQRKEIPEIKEISAEKVIGMTAVEVSASNCSGRVSFTELTLWNSYW